MIQDLDTPKTFYILIGKKLGSTLHPTQKPVALCEYLIKTYTNENDIVLDNCAGSMSTAIACINTNRQYIMIEKDENYFNIGKKYLEKVIKHILLLKIKNLMLYSNPNVINAYTLKHIN